MHIIITESRLQTNVLIVQVVLVRAIVQAIRRLLSEPETRIQSQPSGARSVVREEALGQVFFK
jgi:hypothetical protein